MKSAFAVAINVAALAIPSETSAQGYTYQGPGYSYTRPPYSYQPPPYSYMPPSYTYEPPGYVYTPPGLYRRGYRANTPDYNQSYQYPPSAYGYPPDYRSAWQQNLRDPYYNRFGNPRNPTDVWNSAPPYESSPR
ncbi:MAG TPA: hypothetical protein VIF14_02335 [Alphaproteobacteria bacterium]|jgi:hypothetical protein